jgi:hypothetical protein
VCSDIETDRVVAIEGAFRDSCYWRIIETKQPSSHSAKWSCGVPEVFVCLQIGNQSTVFLAIFQESALFATDTDDRQLSHRRRRAMTGTCRETQRVTSDDDFTLSMRVTMRHLVSVALILCSLSACCRCVAADSASSASPSSGRDVSESIVTVGNSSDGGQVTDHLEIPAFDAAAAAASDDENEAANARNKRSRTGRVPIITSSADDDDDDEDDDSSLKAHSGDSRPWMRSGVSKVIVYVSRRAQASDDDEAGSVQEPDAESISTASGNLTDDTWRARQRSVVEVTLINENP